MKQKIYHLIKLISNGNYYSFDFIEKSLNINSAQILIFLNELKNLNLPFEIREKNELHLLFSLDLLDKNSIILNLNSNSARKVMTFNQISSTNSYWIKRKNILKNGDVCLAEMQTKGRGQNGKTWISPFGTNIYLSYFWRFYNQNLSGLSLACGIALADLLNKNSANQIQLKWPNDLLLNGKKIGGILLEIVGNQRKGMNVIIGFGLNLNMKPFSNLEKKWENFYFSNKNQLIVKIIDQLDKTMKIFEQSGFLPFFSRWNQFDYFLNKDVNVFKENQLVFTGKGKGINIYGEYLVENNENVFSVLAVNHSVRSKIEGNYY